MTAKVTIVQAPNGVAHSKDTVRRMAKLARKGAHTYKIRSLTTKVIAGVPSKDRRGELAAIYKYVRDRAARYCFDPVGLEWIQAPSRTLKERAGDCDDFSILIGAMAESVGHQVRFRTVGATPQRQAHVSVEAWDGSTWVSMDPVLEPPGAAMPAPPRDSLGMFGRRVPGSQRLYDGKGSPMGNPLWQPTALERTPALQPRVITLYRSHGAPVGPAAPIQGLWPNPYDRHDLSGLGFPLISAIASGAGALIGKGIKKRKAKKKKAAAAKKKKKAAAAAKKKAAANGGGEAAQVASVARAGLHALQASQSEAINAIARVAIVRGAPGQAPRVLVPVTKPSARGATKKKKKAKGGQLRRRWDPKAKKWVLYRRKGAQLSGVRPLVTLGPGARPGVSFALGAVPTDQALARKLAPGVAASVATKKYSYDRTLTKRFQGAAGLTPDGFYAGRTRGALRFYGVRNPPAALFAPTAEQPYTIDAPAPVAPAPAAPAPTTPYAPTAAPAPVAPAPKPIVTVAAPAPAPAPRPAAKPSARKVAAQRAIDAVRTFQRRNKGLAPRVPLPAVATYQRAAGLADQKGLYGSTTRAQAARDLRVPVASLPVPAPFRVAPAAPVVGPGGVRPAPTPAKPKPYQPPAPAPVRPSPAPVVVKPDQPVIWEPVQPQPLPPPDPFPGPMPGEPGSYPVDKKPTPWLAWAFGYYLFQQKRRAA